MRTTSKIGNLSRSFIYLAKESLPDASSRMFRSSPVFAKWNIARMLASVSLLAVGVAMYLNMASEGNVSTGSQSDHREERAIVGGPQQAESRAHLAYTYPLQLFWTKAQQRVQVDWDRVLDVPKEKPMRETGPNGRVRQTVQQELIGLQLATIEEGQFQASVAEADDAGHGQLLRQAGYTEQQIRNAQERQREAIAEAEADLLYRQLTSINALAELRRRGLADFQGNVNVAAAHDAGFRTLLLHSGITEWQILNALHRQRQAIEEAAGRLSVER